MQLKHKAAAIVAGFGAVMSSAHAALSTDQAAAFTAIQTTGTDMITAAWPVVIAIVGGLIGIKLFKKVSSRAS